MSLGCIFCLRAKRDRTLLLFEESYINRLRTEELTRAAVGGLGRAAVNTPQCEG